MKNVLKILALVVLIVAPFISIELSAQVETGQLAGTVTDPTGAVLAGATVTAKNTGTNAVRNEITSETGAYRITGLEPATYEVVIQSTSFQPYTAKVQITVGGHVTLDAKLSVGSSTTQVEVVGEGGSQVNTQTQELSQIVNEEQISRLPSLTRNPYDFVALSGNVSSGDSSSSGDSRSNNTYQNGPSSTRAVGFSINGQRASGTEVLLDGVEYISVFGDGIGVYVPVDAVREFRITTSNFEAQYGRASGGIVNVSTKAGSNAFHGGLWEFNRLAAYTSNTETNDQINSAFLAQGGTGALPAPKGQYTRNQFGFAVGGPVMKDKLFFFGSTEWTRVRSGATLTAAVPTSEFLSRTASSSQDFFNTYGGNNKFTFTKTYLSGPSGIGSFVGVPDGTPVFGQVSFNAPANAGGGVPQNTYNIVGRGDYVHSDKTQMFFRYVNYDEVDQSGGVFASPYPQYNVGETFQDTAYLFSLSHVFNPSLITSTKLSFSRLNTFQTYDAKLQNSPVLITSVNAQVPGTSTFIQLPGFFDENPAVGGLPFGGPQNTIQWNQDLNWTKGSHSMQFGGQLLYIQDNQAYGAFAQATEQLGATAASGIQNLVNGVLTNFQAAVNPKGSVPCVKNPYTGALTQTSACSINLPATAPSFARSERFHDWAAYAQDSYRVLPKLTLNFGVRYEYYGVQHNNNRNLDSNYYYGSGSDYYHQIRNGQVLTTPNSPIHGLWQPQYGTVSPRAGFAYDLLGDGKTSLRGGAGISYERNFGNVTFNVIQNPPNYAVIVLNGVPVTSSNTGPLEGSSGSVPLPPTSLRNVDENIRTAQTQFYSLALEHQLARNTMVSVQYAGARGIHLYDIKNINGLGSGNVFAGDPLTDGNGHVALTRLNNQYSNINNRGSNGDSHYQAMNIQFQATNLYHSWLSLVANYTLAHATDELSTAFSETNNAFFLLGYMNPFKPSLDYGNSDLDIRHRLVVAPIYSSQFFAGSHGAMKQALFGWQISGIYSVRTGTPFPYFDSTNDSQAGQGYNVPRYTPSTPISNHTFKSTHGADGGGQNAYVIGNLAPAVSFSNPNLVIPTFPNGISDWGPYPTNMTARNEFRGPGAWNLDAALSKTFPIHERLNLVFRAEGFDVFNHHNLYIQESLDDVANVGYGVPVPITASKGGIGNNGGANDERRFGQFSLAINF
ncbi:TonB-dependent receptor [Telmatobacter sp. DSM 110680]|uniref:TonB-dependent receptor n=1 Tax=Telmatobacter sp. DSM 110680 TaxID=3036704 RepID=A0AAU7DJ00_9BACT